MTREILGFFSKIRMDFRFQMIRAFSYFEFELYDLNAEIRQTDIHKIGCQKMQMGEKNMFYT